MPGPRRLPRLLTKQGRGEEVERVRRLGLNPDGRSPVHDRTSRLGSSRCRNSAANRSDASFVVSG
jgi:hypothetical protein